MTSEQKRIFIVEDEVLIAFEMADALEDLGFEVVGPSTHLGNALDMAQDMEIDMACLDVNLGKGKTSEPIAKILAARGIPYVYITAYDVGQIPFIDPNDNVLQKPVSMGDLRRLLIKATEEE
ncbi:response regulator [Sulfitobacter sp. HNIBRBA2951]|uniref:response regulator n=1 Tax=Sulfitobacter aquimarinus TaxID=3158557 RepID=UPI0032DFC907